MTSTHSQPRNPMAAVVASRDFRLLLIGQGASLLGDQFYLIATPWLVLQLTGDPLVLGAILALAGLPRAIFLLLGGAVTDRFSPRAIMLVSDLVRLGLMAGLTALVLSHSLQVWMLYAFSLLFGTAAGFFMPASSTIVPRLVGKENLPAGNAIWQGIGLLAQFIGPVLAGGAIAWAGRGLSNGHSLDGAALAFAIDAITFLASIVTLWRIAVPPATSAASEKVIESIWAGLRYLWQDEFIRLVLVNMAFGGFLMTGPLMVGIPVLATTRLAGGAATFGMLMSLFAGGSLLGLAGAGALPRPDTRRLKALLIVLSLFCSLGYFALARVTSTSLAGAVMLLIGLGLGYQGVMFFTAIQRRVPGNLMGRLMSLVFLFNVGLTPLSQAVAGAVIKWSLAGLFSLAGLLFAVLVIWSALRPQYQMMGEILAARPAGD